MEDQKINACEKKQVHGELGQLNHSIERLDKTVNSLRERLSCVSNKNVATTEKIGKNLEPLAPVAQTIRNNTQCVDNLGNVLNDIIAGLEI